MSIPEILSFLRKPASGSAALRSKLAEVETAIPAAESTVARLAAERSSRLLDADDKALERIEADHASAVRSVDRLRAARDELSRRLAIAEADEARAALDRDRADAEKLATETAEKVRSQYVKAARTIAALVDDLDRAERRVAEVNAKLADAGRFDDLIKPVEARAIPEPDEVRPEPFKLYTASLPPAPGFAGLGLARDRAEIAGVVAAMVG